MLSSRPGSDVLDAQFLDREVVDVVIDRGASQLDAPAKPLHDLTGRRQGDRGGVTQTRLAQRDQDQEVLGGLVERERRDGPIALERRPGLGVGVLRREDQELRGPLTRRQRDAGELERHGRRDPPRSDRDVLTATLRVVDDVGRVRAEVGDQPVVLGGLQLPGEPGHALVGEGDVDVEIRAATAEAEGPAGLEVNHL